MIDWSIDGTNLQTDIVPNSLHRLSHFIFIKAQCILYDYSHFANEETEEQWQSEPTSVWFYPLG